MSPCQEFCRCESSSLLRPEFSLDCPRTSTRCVAFSPFRPRSLIKFTNYLSGTANFGTFYLQFRIQCSSSCSLLDSKSGGSRCLSFFDGNGVIHPIANSASSQADGMCCPNIG